MRRRRAAPRRAHRSLTPPPPPTAESSGHEGKRKTESIWPIFRINHPKSRFVFSALRDGVIDRAVFDFCVKEGYADGALCAKWRKPGFSNLCCLTCASTQAHNHGTVCICRVPRKELDAGKVFECPHCGCRGCADGDDRAAAALPAVVVRALAAAGGGGGGGGGGACACEWALRSTFSVDAMPWDWPAEVPLDAALAFCAWARARLPTLAEHRALFSPAADAADALPCASGEACDAAPAPRRFNVDGAWHSPSAVDAGAPAAAGAHDARGSAWEWVLDARAAPPARHALAGGAWMTSGDPATGTRYAADARAAAAGPGDAARALTAASFRYARDN